FGLRPSSRRPGADRKAPHPAVAGCVERGSATGCAPRERRVMNVRATAQAGATSNAGVSERPPLQRIRCLLPVWGYAYVKTFLEVGLPTWLADGNLPAVARMLPTEFVLLTS